MNTRKWNRFVPYLIILVSPWVGGASLLADEGRGNSPIVVVELTRDQCIDRCASDRQVCAGRCPGYDENNVVDPSYAARKCKAACDKVLAQCKSICPKD